MNEGGSGLGMDINFKFVQKMKKPFKIYSLNGFSSFFVFLVAVYMLQSDLPQNLINEFLVQFRFLLSPQCHYILTPLILYHQV